MREFKRVIAQPYWLAVVILLFFINILFFVYSNKSDMVGNYSNYNHIYTEELNLINQLDSSERVAYTSDYLSDYQKRLTAVSRLEMKKNIDQSNIDIDDIFMESDPEMEQLMKEVDVQKVDSYIRNVNIASDLSAQCDYITNYPNKLQQLQEKASKMKHITIFNDPDSFEYQNIVKTSEAFRDMEDQTLTYGNDHLVLAVINDDGVVLCGLILLLVTALSFVQERKYDLDRLFYTYPKGRIHLAAYRTGIMGVVSFMVVILFYGSRIILASVFYSMPQQWTRLLQSISAFQDFPVPMTIGTFFVLYGCLLFLAFFMMGMLLWLLVSAAKHINLSLAIFALFLGLEYYLYHNVGISDAHSWRMSLNFFNILSMKAVFYRYLNYRILGTLIGELPLLIIGIIIATIILCTLILCMSRQARKSEVLAIPRWFRVLKIKQTSLAIRGGVPFIEHKKLWITAKGLFVIIIYGIFLITQYNLPLDKPTDSELAIRSCVSKYSDSVDSDLIDRISSDREVLNTSYTNLTKQPNNMNAQRIEQLSMQIAATDIVLDHTVKLANSNKPTWLLNYWIYDNLYGDFSKNWRLLQFSILALVLILIVVPLAAYDNQLTIKSYLRTLPEGQDKLINLKLRMTCLISTGIWLMFSLREWFYINKYAGGFKGILSNSISIGSWGNEQPNLPIFVEIIVLYSTRLLITIALGLLIFLVAQYSSTIIKGIAVLTLMITIPVIIGQWPSFSIFHRFSFTGWMADVGIIPQPIVMIVMFLLVVLIVILNKKSWRRY